MRRYISEAASKQTLAANPSLDSFQEDFRQRTERIHRMAQSNHDPEARSTHRNFKKNMLLLYNRRVNPKLRK